MGMGIAALRETIRARRELLGLSREGLANRAVASGHEQITRHSVEALEVRYQRLPPPHILRPVTDALELNWEEVLRVAGY